MNHRAPSYSFAAAKGGNTSTINNRRKMNSYYRIFIREKMTTDDKEATDSSKNERTMNQS